MTRWMVALLCTFLAAGCNAPANAPEMVSIYGDDASSEAAPLVPPPHPIACTIPFDREEMNHMVALDECSRPFTQRLLVRVRGYVHHMRCGVRQRCGVRGALPQGTRHVQTGSLRRRARAVSNGSRFELALEQVRLRLRTLPCLRRRLFEQPIERLPIEVRRDGHVGVQPVQMRRAPERARAQDPRSTMEGQ